MNAATKVSYEVNARAKAFSSEGVRENRFCVDLSDNSVRVWDSVAGHYTDCHSLNESAKRRIIRLVKQEAE